LDENVCTVTSQVKLLYAVQCNLLGGSQLTNTDNVRGKIAHCHDYMLVIYRYMYATLKWSGKDRISGTIFLKPKHDANS